MKDYSFATEPSHAKQFTSALIDDLSIEVDERSRVALIWGLCPYTRWKRAKLTPPLGQPGALYLIPDHPFKRGVSVQINSKKYLPTYFDPESGWIRIEGQVPPASTVEVFNGVIFEIGDKNQFSSLWLKPQCDAPIPIPL
jgi:hypothetical protein